MQLSRTSVAVKSGHSVRKLRFFTLLQTYINRLDTCIYLCERVGRISAHECIVLVGVYWDNVAVARREVKAVIRARQGGEVFEVGGLLHNVVAVAVSIGHHQPLGGVEHFVDIRTFNADVSLGDLLYLAVRTACVIGFREVDTFVGLIFVIHIVGAVLTDNIGVDSVVAVLRSKEKSRRCIELFQIPAVSIVHNRAVVSSGNSRREVYHIRLLFGIVDSLRSPSAVAFHHIRVLVGYLDNCVIEPVNEIGGFGGNEIAVAVPAEGGLHIRSEEMIETVLAFENVGIAYALSSGV